MDAKTLFENLKKLQEPKGYYFNEDMDMTMPLIESLLTNKERLGYMACPCRLANGEFEADKDIICPCTYREEDVKEFGACFCALYVSKEYNEGTVEKNVVPERRPPEKILF
ncbi:ferredoxin-thioredoxin reductase catalytic domain-containing protein [Pseudodesulfovibrio sp. zrk46]|uniref:ferredoxin-thioredoxin reductase catalytic domain-containing protein n=1 Tax=Pseudodesulfovibrio sp. zrk46 TaxID=2725288 RepID=UPI0014492BCE|nr:ferredoxin-thioredoxin reductase catalytic domain-containing protein [Pseudodesulfovibrio sp. zrk46]QJB57827.1 ferredoxin:thioredoxin reductase [Pseudodesulfovibrio sp. zrk46]